MPCRSLPYLLLPALLISASAEPMTVTDSKGRSLSIDLLGLDDDVVTFTVPARGDKEYDYPIARFDADSQTQIRETAKDLPVRIPKVDIDVVVGKRRKKMGYYMVHQTVSAKVTIKNLSRTTDFPASKGRILFIGRNRRNDDKYMVLNAQDFDVEIPALRTLPFAAKPFTTEYDSDNSGYGNVGGYQYDAYIVFIRDDEGKVLTFHSSDPSIRSVLKEDILLPAKVATYSAKTLVTDKLSVIEK